MQLVEAQTLDPITGVMRGEKSPGLGALNEQQNADTTGWSKEDLEQYVASLGVDSSSAEGEWLISALGK